MSESTRGSRKLEHIQYALTIGDGPAHSRFADFHLLHNCLPELALAEVSLATTFVGIELEHPLIINAITGGTDDVMAVNAKLAEVAKRTGTAMAIGSQFAAFRDQSVISSYQVVRQINPLGILFANIGAHATVDQAKRAVEMIDAAALQIHLNPAQELMMPEGDRDFCGYLANIAAIVEHIDVPVIVKETGCGIAAEQAVTLLKAGVHALDVGGAGGTNFPAIEAARARRQLDAGDLAWGISTAISAVEIVSVLPYGVDLIVSGGVRTPHDAMKSLAIGARAIAVAGPLLRLVLSFGVDAAVNWVEEFKSDLGRLLLLTGCKCPADAANKPLIISGFSREWLTARSIDPNAFARRGRTK